MEGKPMKVIDGKIAKDGPKKINIHTKGRQVGNTVRGISKDVFVQLKQVIEQTPFMPKKVILPPLTAEDIQGKYISRRTTALRDQYAAIYRNSKGVGQQSLEEINRTLSRKAEGMKPSPPTSHSELSEPTTVSPRIYCRWTAEQQAPVAKSPYSEPST